MFEDLPKSPRDLVWIEGPLPPVESVPYDCMVLIWTVCRGAHKSVPVPGDKYAVTFAPAPEYEGVLRRLVVAYPWKNELNPLKWSDGSLPIGYEEEVMFYAWIKKGTQKPQEDDKCRT